MPRRWKYTIIGVFATSVVGLLGYGTYDDIIAQQKIQREQDQAALEEQKAKKDQEEAEWVHCVDSKGNDPIRKTVCLRFDYEPGFMALSGVDCRKFGIVSRDQDKEEAGFCVASKGIDSICQKVCINHGQHGELARLGIDCTKFGVKVDSRSPFEIRMEEEDRKFGQAMAACLRGDQAACEHRRGDP